MATQKLNLTRDQLATFLKNQEQIKQFEKLFQVADTLSPIIVVDFEFAGDNAQATANNALSMIAMLAQDTAVSDAAFEAKLQQALDAIPRLAQALELLALAPVRNNIELEHDVNGILPYANQTARVRSNQVLTWLSM
jgi:hypothetical protein